jgi:hypothetical protein
MITLKFVDEAFESVHWPELVASNGVAPHGSMQDIVIEAITNLLIHDYVFYVWTDNKIASQ